MIRDRTRAPISPDDVHMDASESPPWPPPVGTCVRGPSGHRFEVIAFGVDARLGEHVILRGWQTFPVTRRTWQEAHYVIVDGPG
jgi:hypothetical protein